MPAACSRCHCRTARAQHNARVIISQRPATLPPAAGHTTLHSALCGRSAGPTPRPLSAQQHRDGRLPVPRCATTCGNLQAGTANSVRPSLPRRRPQRPAPGQPQLARRRRRRLASTTPSRLTWVSLSNASNSAAKRSASPSAACTFSCRA